MQVEMAKSSFLWESTYLLKSIYNKLGFEKVFIFTLKEIITIFTRSFEV